MICSVEEAAAELHTTPRRIRELCTQGKLPAIKTGKNWLVQLGQPPKRNDRATSGRDIQRRKGKSA